MKESEVRRRVCRRERLGKQLRPWRCSRRISISRVYIYIYIYQKNETFSLYLFLSLDIGGAIAVKSEKRERSGEEKKTTLSSSTSRLKLALCDSAGLAPPVLSCPYFVFLFGRLFFVSSAPLIANTNQQNYRTS